MPIKNINPKECQYVNVNDLGKEVFNGHCTLPVVISEVIITESIKGKIVLDHLFINGDFGKNATFIVWMTLTHTNSYAYCYLIDIKKDGKFDLKPLYDEEYKKKEGYGIDLYVGDKFIDSLEAQLVEPYCLVCEDKNYMPCLKLLILRKYKEEGKFTHYSNHCIPIDFNKREKIKSKGENTSLALAVPSKFLSKRELSDLRLQVYKGNADQEIGFTDEIGTLPKIINANFHISMHGRVEENETGVYEAGQPLLIGLDETKINRSAYYLIYKDCLNITFDWVMAMLSFSFVLGKVNQTTFNTRVNTWKKINVFDEKETEDLNRWDDYMNLIIRPFTWFFNKLDYSSDNFVYEESGIVQTIPLEHYSAQRILLDRRFDCEDTAIWFMFFLVDMIRMNVDEWEGEGKESDKNFLKNVQFMLRHYIPVASFCEAIEPKLDMKKEWRTDSNEKYFHCTAMLLPLEYVIRDFKKVDESKIKIKDKYKHLEKRSANFDILYCETTSSCYSNPKREFNNFDVSKFSEFNNDVDIKYMLCQPTYKNGINQNGEHFPCMYANYIAFFSSYFSSVDMFDFIPSSVFYIDGGAISGEELLKKPPKSFSFRTEENMDTIKEYKGKILGTQIKTCLTLSYKQYEDELVGIGEQVDKLHKNDPFNGHECQKEGCKECIRIPFIPYNLTNIKKGETNENNCYFCFSPKSFTH